MIALDASALLAMLFREPGGDRVAERLEGACISAVNWSEVLQRFARDGISPLKVAAALDSAAFEIVAFDVAHAARCAELAPLTRSAGLSLADRACLALALERDVVALTADRAWTGVDVGVEVELVR